MRWIGSMAADEPHPDARWSVPLSLGRPRALPTRQVAMLYEGAPMALLIERAGGAANDGQRCILDITPSRLHERVAVILSSRDEVHGCVRFPFRTTDSCRQADPSNDRVGPH